MRLKLLILIFALLIGVTYQQQVTAHEPESQRVASAQGGPTSTPAPVILPSGTATIQPATETPTRTPTSAGPGLIEAKNPDTNVRAGAGTDYDRVGQIQPGTRYVVRGRYFQWFQIEYPDAPTGIGWVHESVINLIGNPAEIPDLSFEELPTPDETLAAQQETLLAATLTPGGILQLTEQAQTTPQGVFTATPDVGQQPTLAPGQRLPTFTFPAFTPTPVSAANLRERVQVDSDGDSLPPIIPIAALGALGLMGLFISILRRF